MYISTSEKIMFLFYLLKLIQTLVRKYFIYLKRIYCFMYYSKNVKFLEMKMLDVIVTVKSNFFSSSK